MRHNYGFLLKTNLIMEKIRNTYNSLEKFFANEVPAFGFLRNYMLFTSTRCFSPVSISSSVRVAGFSFLKFTPGVIMLTGNGVVRR